MYSERCLRAPSRTDSPALELCCGINVQFHAATGRRALAGSKIRMAASVDLGAGRRLCRLRGSGIRKKPYDGVSVKLFGL